MQDFAASLKTWRQARRLSQLALSVEADVSARHIAFLETGRARPSRGMVLRLAGALEVPRGERNAMLTATAIYVVALLILATTFGNHGLWAALMVLNTARAVTLALRYPALEASAETDPG